MAGYIGVFCADCGAQLGPIVNANDREPRGVCLTPPVTEACNHRRWQMLAVGSNDVRVIGHGIGPVPDLDEMWGHPGGHGSSAHG